MRYCVKCVQTDTRPGIRFDEEQVCSACRAAEYRKQVDWNKREESLDTIVNLCKGVSYPYDCVIGVSGGKDSHFQAFYARDTLGLRPLLVNSVPENITDVGRANLDNLASHGFDLISIRPNPAIMKRLITESFFKYGNPAKATEYSLFSSAWIIAYKFGIPLVIQGENPAHTLGIVDDMDIGGNAMTIFQHNTIREDIIDWNVCGVSEEDLALYHVPEEYEDNAPFRYSIWLEYYAKEWSFTGNTEFAISKGLKGRRSHYPVETGKMSSYCSIDSDLHIQNQFIKYLKFGFGFVTDEVGYDIREGRMTREQGIELVRLYDGRCDMKYIDALCKYMDMPYSEFWYVLDHHVNKELFEKEAPIMGTGDQGLW